MLDGRTNEVSVGTGNRGLLCIHGRELDCPSDCSAPAPGLAVGGNADRSAAVAVVSATSKASAGSNRAAAPEGAEMGAACISFSVEDDCFPLSVKAPTEGARKRTDTIGRASAKCFKKWGGRESRGTVIRTATTTAKTKFPQHGCSARRIGSL